MKQQDAIKILEISGEITPAIVKAAYRKASSKYHPDKGGSVQAMQAVNEAYEVLKDFTGTIESESDNDSDYMESLNAAINAIVALPGLHIEICGAWVWVTGDTKTHKELIKNAGYKWASKKKAWYFRPSDWKRSNRSGEWTLDQIRQEHGSQAVQRKFRKALHV